MIRQMILVLLVGALLLTLASTAALAAARYGTDGHDVLFGTHSADQIYGYGGDDIISGLRGSDLIYGGRGEDALWGSYGADNLYGRSGTDDLHGMGGDDYISAKDGRRELVDCGPGRDWFNTDSFDVVRNCEVPAIT
jgi:Ca2+-binding RTX toxin-like protein